MVTRAALRYAARPHFAYLLAALIVGTLHLICCVFLARPRMLRVKADRMLCSVVLQDHASMPRASGARTGKKHKKRKLNPPAIEDGSSEEPRLAAAEAAVASLKVAAQVATGDGGAVRKWLYDMLEQVEKQVADDEDRAQLERDRHHRVIGVGVACVEDVKSVALSNNLTVNLSARCCAHF